MTAPHLTYDKTFLVTTAHSRRQVDEENVDIEDVTHITKRNVLGARARGSLPRCLCPSGYKVGIGMSIGLSWMFGIICGHVLLPTNGKTTLHRGVTNKLMCAVMSHISLHVVYYCCLCVYNINVLLFNESINVYNKIILSWQQMITN